MSIIIGVLLMYALPVIITFSATLYVIRKIESKISTPVAKIENTNLGSDYEDGVRIHWSFKYALSIAIISVVINLLSRNVGWGDLLGVVGLVLTTVVATMVFYTASYLTKNVKSKVYKFALWIPLVLLIFWSASATYNLYNVYASNLYVEKLAGNQFSDRQIIMDTQTNLDIYVFQKILETVFKTEGTYPARLTKTRSSLQPDMYGSMVNYDYSSDGTSYTLCAVYHPSSKFKDSRKECFTPIKQPVLLPGVGSIDDKKVRNRLIAADVITQYEFNLLKKAIENYKSMNGIPPHTLNNLLRDYEEVGHYLTNGVLGPLSRGYKYSLYGSKFELCRYDEINFDEESGSRIPLVKEYCVIR